MLFVACGWTFAVQAHAAPPNTPPAVRPIERAQYRQVQAPHIAVQLIAAQQSVQPGQTFWVGLHQKIQHHWHTYWRNPGDSGTAPKMRWTLQKGVSISPIQWPYPERIKVAHLVNYGYSDEVLLLYRVTLDKAYQGRSLRLEGRFSWLVCKGECIPGKAFLGLELAVSPSNPQPNPKWQPLFAHTLARLPAALPSNVLQLATTATHVDISIPSLPTALRTANALQLFPATPSVLENAALPNAQRKGPSMRWIYPKNEYFQDDIKRFQGVLVASWQRDGKTLKRAYSLQGNLASVAKAPTSAPAVASKTPNAAPPARITPALPTAGTKISTSSSPNHKPLVSSTAMTITRGLDWYIARAKAKKSQGAAKSNASESEMELWLALLFALFGGLLLNLMPCVFPVLSIKIMQFVEQAESSPTRIRAHGFAFVGGVLLSFTLLASLLLGLRASGQALGWGFQLQSPLFVWGLLVLFFAMGLSLSGVFEFGMSLMQAGGNIADRGGYMGSFFTGILATVVATPCTAPLMAPALGWAMTQPAISGLLVFWALGLGMALPYALLAWFPAGLRFLPRPGLWMERLKQVMAFALYGTGIWLLWVLGKQTGPEGMITALMGLLGVSFAAWLYGRTQLSAKRHLAAATAGTIIIASCVWASNQLLQDAQHAQHTQAQHKKLLALQQKLDLKQRGIAFSGKARSFTRPLLDQLLQSQQHVFLNMTAAWCISCKVNEKVALRVQSVQEAFRKYKIHYVVGDWTQQDNSITRVLGLFKRNGVPLYVLFDGKSGEFQVLPQILTPNILHNAIKQTTAHPSHPANTKRASL